MPEVGFDLPLLLALAALSGGFVLNSFPVELGLLGGCLFGSFLFCNALGLGFGVCCSFGGGFFGGNYLCGCLFALVFGVVGGVPGIDNLQELHQPGYLGR